MAFRAHLSARTGGPGTRPSTSATVLALPFLVVLCIIILLCVESLHAISSVRAGINAGASWSKGVKTASYCLSRYAVTRHASDFDCYQRAIQAPLAFHDARGAMLAEPMQTERARASLEAGGVDSADIADLLRIHRLFSLFPRYADAMEIWHHADDEFALLQQSANGLHTEIAKAAPDERVIARWMAQVDVINENVGGANAKFGAKVGSVARQMADIMAIATSLCALGLALLAIGLTRLRLSERERYASIVTQSERRYRELFEHCHDAMIVATPEGNIIEANRAAEALLGYSQAELIALGRAGILDETTAQWRAASAFREANGYFRAELEYQRRDGSLLLCEVASNRFDLANDEALNSIILRDVSERDRAQEQLIQLSAFYKATHEVSQLLLHVDNAQSLFSQLSRIIVESGGLSFAALAYRSDPDVPYRLLASYGLPPVGSESIDTFVDKHLEGDDPRVLDALRQSQPLTFSLGQSDAPDAPVCMALPLIERGMLAGVLMAGADEASVLTDIVGDLLIQIAEEASFALDGFRMKAARARSDSLLAGQNEILHLLASGSEIEEILAVVVRFMETFSPQSRCAALVAHATQPRFAWVVAPNMPESYHRMAMRTMIGPEGGPISEAFLSQRPVFVPDLRELATSVQASEVVSDGDLRATQAWPILGRKGQPLGALAMYYDTPGTHPALDHDLIVMCSGLAGIAIETRQDEDRIRHMAHFDDLTGLPNRALYRESLTEALRRATRGTRTLAVLLIDLDRFKAINDTFGHDAGDRALRRMAQKLSRALREGDIIARLGGDEFVVLLEDCGGPREVGDVATRLIGAAAANFVLDGHDCQLTASVGAAIFPTDGRDAETLLRNADIAMYRAKSAGRNNFQFYSPEMNQHTLERMALESSMRRAVRAGEFRVYFQPKIDIRSGAVVGAEALVRWQHPQRGLLLASEFIGVSEETGLVRDIGRVVLEDACKTGAQWIAQGLPALRISINLSAPQFEDPALLEEIDRVLLETGFPADRLELEITETVMMQNHDRMMPLLEVIRAKGIHLSMDDFGTGYSSLAYLKRFPVNSLKIDRSFVVDMPGDANDVTITRAIIALAHSLSLTVVAEGVETEAQLELLGEMGCEQAQGFYFCEAVPAEEFVRFVQHDAPRFIHDVQSRARRHASS